MIKKVEDGKQVLSEKGKNLAGPYKTLEEAKKRLRQVEFFKHRRGGKMMDFRLGDELAPIPHAIESRTLTHCSENAHRQGVAANRRDWRRWHVPCNAN